MQKPNRLIHTIAERLPRRRHAEFSTPASVVDVQSQQWHEELENYQYNEPYYTLAESLDMFARTTDSATGNQQSMMRRIITADAHDLAARLLSESHVEVMGVTPKHPENIAMEYTGSFSLRSMYLLVHAYDITKDRSLENVIHFAFTAAPPHLSEQLRRAYEHGLETNQPILDTYRLLASIQDEALDIRLVAAGKTEKEMAATGAVDAIPQDD